MAKWLTTVAQRSCSVVEYLVTGPNGLSSSAGDLTGNRTMVKDQALLAVRMLAAVFRALPSGCSTSRSFTSQAVGLLGTALQGLGDQGLLPQDAAVFAAAGSEMVQRLDYRLTGPSVGAMMEGVLQQLAQGVVQSPGQGNGTQVFVVPAANLQLLCCPLCFPTTSSKQAVTVPAAIPLAAPIPADLLQKVAKVTSAIGLRSIRWSGVNPYGPYIGNNATEGPVGDVVSLSASTATGAPLPVADLAQPLLVALPVSFKSQDDLEKMMLQGSAPTCRWWDDQARQWKDTGCRLLEVRKDGSEMLCACTHLTTFSSFMSAKFLWLDAAATYIFATVVQCANVEALTAAGLAKLSSPKWMQRSSAVFFWSLMVMLGLGFILALGLDAVSAFSVPESDQEVGSHRPRQIPPAGCPSCWARLKGRLKEWRDRNLSIVYNRNRWGKHYVEWLIEHVAAAGLGIDRNSLLILMELEEESEVRTLLGHVTVEEAAALQKAAGIESCDVNLLRFCCEKTYREFSRTGWARLHQFRRIFWAFHPLPRSTRRSLRSRFTNQALLVMAPILSAHAANAWFYNSNGAPMSIDNSDDCRDPSPERFAERLVVVSLCTAALSGIPHKLLESIESHRANAASIEPIMVQLSRALLFYPLALCLVVFYALYIAAFLANVDEISALSWAVNGFITCTVCFLLLTPMLKSVFRTLLCVLLIRSQQHGEGASWKPSWVQGKRASDPEAQQDPSKGQPKRFSAVVPVARDYGGAAEAQTQSLQLPGKCFQDGQARPG